jgi:hypothetical protein
MQDLFLDLEEIDDCLRATVFGLARGDRHEASSFPFLRDTAKIYSSTARSPRISH